MKNLHFGNYENLSPRFIKKLGDTLKFSLSSAEAAAMAAARETTAMMKAMKGLPEGKKYFSITRRAELKNNPGVMALQQSLRRSGAYKNTELALREKREHAKAFVQALEKSQDTGAFRSSLDWFKKNNNRLDDSMDGDYGHSTRLAVAYLQWSCNKTVDGVFGQETAQLIEVNSQITHTQAEMEALSSAIRPPKNGEALSQDLEGKIAQVGLSIATFEGDKTQGNYDMALGYLKTTGAELIAAYRENPSADLHKALKEMAAMTTRLEKANTDKLQPSSGSEQILAPEAVQKVVRDAVQAILSLEQMVIQAEGKKALTDEEKTNLTNAIQATGATLNAALNKAPEGTIIKLAQAFEQLTDRVQAMAPVAAERAQKEAEAKKDAYDEALAAITALESLLATMNAEQIRAAVAVGDPTKGISQGIINKAIAEAVVMLGNTKEGTEILAIGTALLKKAKEVAAEKERQAFRKGPIGVRYSTVDTKAFLGAAKKLEIPHAGGPITLANESDVEVEKFRITYPVKGKSEFHLTLKDSDKWAVNDAAVFTLNYGTNGKLKVDLPPSRSDDDFTERYDIVVEGDRVVIKSKELMKKAAEKETADFEKVGATIKTLSEALDNMKNSKTAEDVELQEKLNAAEAAVQGAKGLSAANQEILKKALALQIQRIKDLQAAAAEATK